MRYKWILIGEIVSAQGNKGEVRIVGHTDFPERFLSMDHVLLFRKAASEPAYRLEIEHSRMHKGFIILKLAGIDTIDQALALKGLEIKVDRSDVVPLPSGRNYIFELIGLKVVTTEGLELGEITDVLQTGANDVYVVKPNPGVTQNREILIPVIAEVVLEVDLDKQLVLVNLLDGLLD
ncbi:MAG: ribosome maturation factor RimM [Candidatus Wallacebacter cryptica]|jgi:16S rRNA processing protein RimM|nr:ribosome maturation factor RimM [Bacillota bacterium]